MTAKNVHSDWVAILEAANGPITADADQLFRERHIDVIPDVLCNSGGVIVSYYEWIQNRTYVTWPLEKVQGLLIDRMQDTFNEVYDTAKIDDITYRNAAFQLAIHSLKDWA